VQLRRAARSGKPDERFLLQKAFNYGRLFYSHLMASKRERETEKGQLIAESAGEKFIAKPQSDGFVFVQFSAASERLAVH
jgi:hypothetical protein